MASNVKFIWGKDKLTVIDPIPSNKIKRAKSIVRMALNDELKIGYDNIKRLPLESGNPVRCQITELKLLRDSYGLSKEEIELITSQLKVLRSVERTHYDYDVDKRNELKNNYRSLKNALELLCKAGEVENYLLTTTGRIEVSYFTKYEAPKLVVLEQSWTFEVARNLPDSEVTISYDNKVPNLSVQRILDTYHNRGMDEKGLAYGTMVAKKYEPIGGTGYLDMEVIIERGKQGASEVEAMKAKAMTAHELYLETLVSLLYWGWKGNKVNLYA